MKEFALGINKVFPHIADTRHLMSANDAVQYLMRQKSKSLSSAFSFLCPAFHSTAAESSTRPTVNIEVEADETTYGLSGFFILYVLLSNSLFAYNFFYNLFLILDI
jgi:hypothetical protein